MHEKALRALQHSINSLEELKPNDSTQVWDTMIRYSEQWLKIAEFIETTLGGKDEQKD